MVDKVKNKLSLKKVGIGLVIALFIISAMLSFSSGEKIAVLEIDGVIKNPKEYLDSIKDISEDSSIKGVIVRIDSPGGTVGSSQEIYDSLTKLSEKIPTTASIVDIGASGGYLIACGTSYIFANAGSITGSIGVISQYYDFSKLIKFLKFDIEVIKSGEMKDISSPTRSLNSKEKKLLNLLVNDIHNQFKRSVAERRGLTKDESNLVSDGRVFSGNQALELKLIDEIGGLEAAIMHIEKKTGIQNLDLEYYPIREEKLLDGIIPSIDNSAITNMLGKKLYYLYSPKF
ncbi:signal peptide peptidase SppA [bacterium]|nr:signal peptide peptidase SppA [bacterium]MBT3794942.1 signal peptide peptidase SppA [bacterium]MBT4634678.1 signal peptide peptidase SppA [bacterium]